MLSDRGPLTRIMPMPPGPGGVAMAAIVSAVLLLFLFSVHFNHGFAGKFLRWLHNLWSSTGRAVKLRNSPPALALTGRNLYASRLLEERDKSCKDLSITFKDVYCCDTSVFCHEAISYPCRPSVFGLDLFCLYCRGDRSTPF
jgi:hypothetical protein